MTSFNLTDFSTPNTATLGVRASIYEFGVGGGDTVQFIAQATHHYF